MSEVYGEVGGVWIVGNVEEEGLGRPGCQSKHWAHKDRRDGV